MTRLETDLDRIRQITEQLREIEAQRTKMANERNELLRSLNAAGITMRTLANALGISFQRVGQLVRHKAA